MENNKDQLETSNIANGGFFIFEASNPFRQFLFTLNPNTVIIKLKQYNS